MTRYRITLTPTDDDGPGTVRAPDPKSASRHVDTCSCCSAGIDCEAAELIDAVWVAVPAEPTP